MGRSPRFRVYVPRLCAHFGLAFATATPNGLTLPRNVTRRPIIQKVRSHTLPGPKAPAIVLPLVVSARFQVLLTPLAGVLFTFPSRYWFTIGRRLVSSLGRWSSQIPTGFLGPRGTQEPLRRPARVTHAAVTRSGRPFQAVRLRAGFVTPSGHCRDP